MAEIFWDMTVSVSDEIGCCQPQAGVQLHVSQYEIEIQHPPLLAPVMRGLKSQFMRTAYFMSFAAHSSRAYLEVVRRVMGRDAYPSGIARIPLRDGGCGTE